MTWKRSVRSACYRLGLLPAWHRIRNRDTLTVVAFHRVLPRDDPRWPTADPTWTTSVAHFRSYLRFFARHYNVIGEDDLLAHLDGAAAPKGPALLITFDDGWADTAEHALPCLAELGLPAIVFVVSRTVGSARAFWEEELFSLWRAGAVPTEEWRRLWNAVGGGDGPDLAADTAIPALQRRLRELPGPRREEALAPFLAVAPLPDLAAMADRTQLRELSEGGVSVGAHGATHAPIPLADDIEAELAEPRRSLAEHVGREVRTLAFPHGRYDSEIVQRAYEHDYRAVFDSKPGLYRLPLAGRQVGRVSLPAPGLARGDRIDGGALAGYLFLRDKRDAS